MHFTWGGNVAVAKAPTPMASTWAGAYATAKLAGFLNAWFLNPHGLLAGSSSLGFLFWRFLIVAR